MPDLAPEALDPEAPMLFSTPCRAIGLSLASHEVSDPVARASSGEGDGAASVNVINGRINLSNMVMVARRSAYQFGQRILTRHPRHPCLRLI